MSDPAGFRQLVACALLWADAFAVPSPQFPGMQQEVRVELCHVWSGSRVVVSGRISADLPDGTKHEISPWKELAGSKLYVIGKQPEEPKAEEAGN